MSDNMETFYTAIREHLKAETITVKNSDGEETELLMAPQALQPVDIEPFLAPLRKHPKRRRGTARMQDLESFIRHVNRFKDEHSALFAASGKSTDSAPVLTAVLDYHEQTAAGTPRFGQHRTQFMFPLSEEWQAWKKQSGEALSQSEFAAFLEDRIADIIPAPDLTGENLPDDLQNLADTQKALQGTFAGPDKMMDLARGISINEDNKVLQSHNLQTGEATIVYQSEHKDTAGDRLKVPNLFLIAIPVFENGPLYRLTVRLRYRVRGGAVLWQFDLYRPEKTFDHAFSESTKKAEAATELPLFNGTPE